MIKRINLIEKKAFTFTYLKLMQICIVVLVVNLAFVAYQFYNVSRLEKKIKVATMTLKKLEAQKDDLMKKPVKKKVSVGQYQTLLDTIENTPHWATLLNEMSRNMPNSIWLTGLKSISSVAAEEGAKKTVSKINKKNKKKDDDNTETEKTPPPSAAPKYALELSGIGTDMRNITSFTAKLSDSEIFKNLVISKSEKESFGYSFVVKGDIKTNAQ